MAETKQLSIHDLPIITADHNSPIPLYHQVETSLRGFIQAGLLKPGGVILASSPNVSHYRIIAQLLRGRFEYADVGPMDRTHLRWFTPVSYAQMFEDAGFATRHVGPMTPAGRKTKLLRAASLGLLPASLFMRQVKYIGQKPRGQ